MGRQLGTGTYISPRFQDFPDYDPSSVPWDCVVTIDADVWDGWNQAWIPKSFEFPEDKEKNPDKCKPLMLWTPRWSTCLQFLISFFLLFFGIVVVVVLMLTHRISQRRTAHDSSRTWTRP